MKIKKRTLLYSLLLLTYLNSAQAFDLNSSLDVAAKFLNGARDQIQNQIEVTKKNADEAAKNKEQEKIKEKEKLTSQNSRYLVHANANSGAHWALIRIKFGDKTEDVVFKIDSLEIQKMVSLRFGAGKYNISVFQTNDTEAYRSSYTFISTFEIENVDQRDMSFLLPSDEVQSDDPKIIDLANQIIASAQTDTEKIRAIHDYVANLVSYDYDALINDKYKNNLMDALSVLERPLTVCSGYSNLTAALIRASGIRVRVVHGKALVKTGFMDHAWNEVLINSNWKSLDVTWDDVDQIRYDYFLKNESEIAFDHRKESVMEQY